MTYMKQLLIIFLTGVLSASLAGVSAAQKPTFTLADMHKIQDVGAPSISPDGKQVVYAVSRHNLTADAGESDLWTVPYKGGTPKKLTDTAEESEWAPKFSPNGKLIAFLAEGADDSGTQIFLMPANGGDAQQVSSAAGGVNEFGWAPDSRQLVFTAFAGGAEPNAADTPPPIVVDRFQYKEDWVGYLAGQRRHIHITDIKTMETTQLTDGDQDHWLPSWSPDGKWIAYVSKDRGDADRNMDSDVFIMAPKADAEKRRISSFAGTDVDPYWLSPPAWSPDSKKLAWLASGDSKWIYYAPWQITVADIATGETRAVAHIDRCFYLPKWSADGVHLYSLVEQDRATWVAKINTETDEITYLTNGAKFALDFDVAGNDRIVVQQSDDTTPYEIVAIEKADRALTNHNAWLGGMQLAKTEAFDFKSAGHDIGGLIVYPPDYDSNKSYPAIFRLHGGPVYQHSHEFMYDWQIYAAAGYVVVGINPRGSSGKGFAFSKAIYADWGNVDVQDILAGADHLVAKGIIDPNRLGTGGWSYGGMLTNYVIGTDTRFKAAISGAGTANMLGTYGHDQYSREYELELGTPWQNLDAYIRVSFPFYHADKITTPTLYQCAEKDFNVPCIGAEQMYQALRSVGTKTQLVLYPGQHHGITVPSYLEDRMQRNLEWYGQFLMPERE